MCGKNKYFVVVGSFGVGMVCSRRFLFDFLLCGKIKILGIKSFDLVNVVKNVCFLIIEI